MVCISNLGVSKGVFARSILCAMRMHWARVSPVLLEFGFQAK